MSNPLVRVPTEAYELLKKMSHQDKVTMVHILGIAVKNHHQQWTGTVDKG